MPSIGPTLPPHLEKRKRTPDDEDNETPPPKQARNTDEIDLDDGSSDDDEAYGPSAPGAKPAPAPKPAPVGPTAPPAQAINEAEIDLNDSDDDEANIGPLAPPASKPTIGPSAPPASTKRTMGPSMPPPSAAANPPDDNDNSSSDDEDDYGPALPSSNASTGPQTSIFDNPTASTSFSTEPQAPQRDDWMLAPPSASKGYSERDPTKIKNRRFASNKPHSSAAAGGSGGNSEISSIWTETPEQKRKRLQDAVLGRAGPQGAEGPAGANPASGAAGSGQVDMEQQRNARTAQNVQAAKGRSLYEEHQVTREKQKGNESREEEDDPSKRAFDREKDMALGGKINTSQRRELMNKAKDFSGRFQKGSYL